jgi:EpsI family protein
MSFSQNAPRILAVVLLIQAGLYYGVASRAEKTPGISPLSTFPAASGQWQMEREYPLEQEVLDVLKADDTMNRVYSNSSKTATTSLFVAFFKTQRAGQAPHSPKNCLPGSGWEPLEEGTIAVPVPVWSKPIVVNRYVVAHGAERSVVLYWYHSHNRVIASEYWAKFWLVLDAIRFNRSDTALVRIVVPAQGENTGEATRLGIDMIQAMFPDIVRQFPS